MGIGQIQIRHCILYEYKKGSQPSEATKNICSTYENEAPSIRTCQRWFKQFELGNCFFVDSPRSGSPSSVNLCEAGVHKSGVGTKV